MLWMLRVFLRFLQATCTLVALITVSSGFVVTSYYGYYSMLGSSPVTYTQLTTYMAFLYALLLLLFVELLGWFSRPFWLFEVISDFVMTVMLLVAAIVLLSHDYVHNCSVYGIMLRCGSFTTAVVFTWIAMALFLISLLLSLFWDRGDRSTSRDAEAGRGHHETYSATETPTIHDSPKSPGGRI